MSKSTLTSHFVDLVYTAALASYWYRPAFRRFMASSDVSEGFLATWSEDESKRNFLDKLLPELQKTEAGRNTIQRMARNLAEQSSFPDLKRCEDYPQKLRAAQEAVAALKQYLDRTDRDRQDEREAQKRRERSAQIREMNIRSQNDLGKLKDRLDALANRLGEQKAGYEFQDWFFDLMAFFEVDNRRPYVDPDGRQIDGSITVDGTTYIAELRFKQAPEGTPALDSIFAKVESKADNTMAIFVAMSGFLDAAKNAASKPGTPLLLFDYSHLYLVLSGVQRFQDVVVRTRRHCSQTGRSYLAVSEFSSQ